MSDSVQHRFLAAVDAHRSGDSGGASLLLEELVAQWPSTHEAHYLLGMIRGAQSDFPGARRCFEEALTHDADNPEYLFRLGWVLSREGRPVEAADVLERAVEVAEESPELFIELCRASLASRRFQRAREAAEKAWELGANVPEVRSTLATCYAVIAQALERANQADDARLAAERALSIRPRYAPPLVALGKVNYRDKRYAEARDCLERALECGPGFERRREAHRMLGLTLDQMKDYDLAFDHFQQSKLHKNKVLTPEQAEVKARAFAYIEATRRDVRAEDVARWTAPPEDRPSPVFFVGFPRSGTTLLEQMLGSHPQIVTTDELQTLPAIRDLLTRKMGQSYLVPGRLKDLTPAEITDLRGLYWSKTESSIGAERLRGRLLLDKHPLNTANLAIARRLFPGARVIMALRDPRDVILSCYMMLNRTPISICMFSSLEDTAQFYAANMDLWLHQKKLLGLPWIETRYEELVENPEGRIRGVLEFLGLPWSDEVMKFTQRTASMNIRSASYQQVTQGIHKRARGRWQNYEKHYGAALEILGPYLAALGYND